MPLHLARGALGRPGSLSDNRIIHWRLKWDRHVRVVLSIFHFLLRLIFVESVCIRLRDWTCLFRPSLHLWVPKLFHNSLVSRNLFLLLLQMTLVGSDAQRIPKVFLDIPATELLLHIVHYRHDAFNFLVEFLALVKISQGYALRLSLLAILIQNKLAALHMTSLVGGGWLNSISAGMMRNLAFHLASLESLLDKSLAILADRLISVGLRDSYNVFNLKLLFIRGGKVRNRWSVLDSLTVLALLISWFFKGGVRLVSGRVAAGEGRL